jgi:DNA-binding CsgD family transcriptional regulator
LLEEALELFEACGDWFGQACVLTDLSRTHHALNDKRSARMVFRRAWHMAEMCGSASLRKELFSINGDTHATSLVVGDGMSLLSGSEHRVASLAVIGCTNAEIATRLHITPSTVEQHLTRVYRKLHVKGRKNLPADLGADLGGHPDLS